MMDSEDRQFMLTAAWLFARHGQTSRARTICEALLEDDPRDGISAAAFAELLLTEGMAGEALEALRAASFPPELARAGALLESRALTMMGKANEGVKCWQRYLAAAKGGKKQWI